MSARRSQGFAPAEVWVGIAGNQIARAADPLRALDLPAHAIATSGEWGVAKSAPGSSTE
jgi:hypothetical protein